MKTKKKSRARKKSKKLPKIPKKKILQSEHFIPTGCFSERSKHSWFDIKRYDYGSVKLPTTKEIDIEVLRCKQIKISPTYDQKQLLLKWIELSRLIYNQTVQYLKHNKCVAFYKLRTIIKSLFKPNFIERLKKVKMPENVINNSIKDVLKGRKSAFALLQAGHIKRFRMRFKKQSKPIQTIVIEQQEFSKVKNSFYVSKLGVLNSSLPITQSNIEHDCRLTYDRNKNIFTLNVPTDRKITKSIGTFDTASIDPGLKTFLTIYSPEKECMKIMNRDKTQKLSKLINKKMGLEKVIRSKCIRKAILKNNRKIFNNVKELHYKSANLLCSTYNSIYLGRLSTQSIVKGNLSVFDKHFAHALSHFTFYNILKHKCEEYGKNLHYVDESYTSKTCGCCGSLYDVGSSRTYNCPNCLNSYDRDMNAARLILIKNE